MDGPPAHDLASTSDSGPAGLTAALLAGSGATESVKVISPRRAKVDNSGAETTVWPSVETPKINGTRHLRSAQTNFFCHVEEKGK